MTLQGAIQQLHDMRSDDNFPFYYKPAIDKVIETLQTDVQEVRQGHWIDDCYDQMDGGAYMITVCSACGTPNLVSNYCPNCGAKMNSKE